MDWPNFVRGIYYSLLPRQYWGAWRPASTVDFVYSAACSGFLELLGFSYLWVIEYLHFLAIRTHQMAAASGANASTQIYFFLIVTVEYVFHPLPLLAMCLAGEGVVRAWAAYFTEEILPSFPAKLFLLFQTWSQSRAQKRAIGPPLADLFERLRGQDADLCISSQGPKDGWRPSITVMVEEEFYEVVRIETGQAPRANVYLLRKLSQAAVIRGVYRYDPPPEEPGE